MRESAFLVMRDMTKKYRVVVIGGCGHVGLPLALVSADRGHRTTIYDVNARALATVRQGRMPFLEHGGEALLKQALSGGKLELSEHPRVIGDAEIIILVVGTPVDEHLNPRIDAVFKALDACMPYFRAGQVLVLRSTVYPGVSAKLQEFFRDRKLDVDIVFCPERVAQGHAIREIQDLPQIISGFSPRGLSVAREFFESIAPKVIEIEPLEAELAKLYSNAYRYIEFAIANQFYMIAVGEGADYDRIQTAMKCDYPRLQNLPRPGFAAGPCLFKDTIQLAAFYHHHFSLGLAAVWVNEGMPDFIVERLRAAHPLREKTVGILGMAFKADNDDKRDSLSYKLRKLLRLETKNTLCHDPFIEDPEFVSLDRILSDSDILIIAVPHSAYRDLSIPEDKILVDLWNFLSKRQLAAV
jgi:UDP-N-acetyl-D-mannosaminuronic acid dehydrogenase